MDTHLGKTPARRRTQRRPKLLGALLAAALAVAAVAAPAQGTVPGRNGRIVYSSWSSHHFISIKSVRANGGGEKTLTHPANKVHDLNPDFSPNSGKVVFERDAQRPELYTVNADGKDLTQLTNDPFAADPAYSPDGTRIATERRASGGVEGIFILNADGQNPVLVKQSGNAEAEHPAWSPDGQKLVYVLRKSDRRAALATIDTDGTGERQLTPFRLNADHADWSPDGKRIVFGKNWDAPGGQSKNLYTVRADGTGLKKVTHYRGGVVNAVDPGWSPDGKKITFSRSFGDPRRIWDVFQINANGSHLRKTTTSRLWDFQPDWGARP